MGPKKIRLENHCRICGSAAFHSYVGVLVCPSCKMFFKRNALKSTNVLKCHYDGNCSINFNTRHTCSSCRLKKCFDCGMQVEMLRGHLSKEKKINLDQRVNVSNLVDYWNLDSITSLAIEYLDEQKKLPMKMRFKMNTVQHFIQMLTKTIEMMCEFDPQLRSQSSIDRSYFSKTNIQHVSIFISSSILFRCHLLDDETFCQTMTSIYGAEFMINASLSASQLDHDPILIKMVFSLLIFFPFRTNITNTYSDFIWQYLIDQYDFQFAVRYFSNLIRSILASQRATLIINQ